MSGEPPKRFTSDPTLVLDRTKLVSPEARAAFEAQIKERELEDAATTEVACPTCQRCPSCGGTHLVTPEERSELLRKETGL